MQLDLFYGLPQLFGSILYLALLGSVFWARVIFERCFFGILHCFFLAAIIFIRFFLCLALLDSDFFWPQSFLKAVTKKARTKQLSQTIEKIQLHSWWITVAT